MAAIRVAFDTGPLHGARTGIGHAVAELQAALGERSDVRLQPYLLSFRARPEPPTVRLPVPAALAHRLWPRLPWPRMDRHLGDVQVVHGTNYVVPPSRHPTVVSVYDCWFLRHHELASPSVRRAGEVLKAAVRRGAHVHASSQATAAAVAELLPGAPVTTAHLGPLPLPDPLPRSPLAELTEHRFVLAVGTVERRKNVPSLVRAFAVPAADDPHLRLVLAGSPGDATEAVRMAIDALPPAIGRRVLLTGRIDEPTRGWLLRNAAVLAYPSLDEGFGFPLLDAMQAGVPVVASDAGSIPEVAGDAAMLCAAEDHERLGALLAEVIADPAVAERLVARGREQVRRFSWARCAADMVNLYEVVAGLTEPGTVAPGDMIGEDGTMEAGTTAPGTAAEGTVAEGTVAVVCGGVGAARFLRALAAVHPAERTVGIVNTGDDTVLHGLAISPDLDTITYTLAGAIDPERGWGLTDETWRAMGALARYAAVRPDGSTAAPTWFNLGDQDLATHFYRTARLAEGATLTEVTAEIATAWQIPQRLVPMTDQRVATMVTLAGDAGRPDREVTFQEYFVQLRHSVPVAAVRFAGAEQAALSPIAGAAIAEAAVVVIAPSNPLVSIGPIRALAGVDELLAGRRASVVAVSPIVGGAALKGPADRMLVELGHEPSVVGVARLYAPIAAALVIDPVDAHLADAVAAEGIRPVVQPSIMADPAVAAALAQATLAAAS